MKRVPVVFFVLIALFMVILGCGGKSDVSDGGGPEKAAKAEKAVELNYSIFFPASHLQAQTAAEWAREIEKRTEGRVKITMFPGGTLTQAPQCYEGVVNGISDIGMSVFAYTRGKFPLLEGLDLPVGYPDGLTATRAANEMVELYDPKELEDVKVLYLHAHGPGILASKKSIDSVDDLSGMKIRATGLSAKIVSALDAVPIAMSQGETYEALQKGVAEATFCPVETLKGWKQGEVIDYVVDTRAIGYTTAMFAVMNKGVWESLPEDIQAVFDEVNSEWIDRHGRAWDRADEEGEAFVRDLGKTFVELDERQEEALVDAVQPILAEYVDTVEAGGLPGREFLKDLQEYLAK